MTSLCVIERRKGKASGPVGAGFVCHDKKVVESVRKGIGCFAGQTSDPKSPGGAHWQLAIFSICLQDPVQTSLTQYSRTMAAMAFSQRSQPFEFYKKIRSSLRITDM